MVLFLLLVLVVEYCDSSHTDNGDTPQSPGLLQVGYFQVWVCLTVGLWRENVGWKKSMHTQQSHSQERKVKKKKRIVILTHFIRLTHVSVEAGKVIKRRVAGEHELGVADMQQ